MIFVVLYFGLLAFMIVAPATVKKHMGVWGSPLMIRVSAIGVALAASIFLLINWRQFPLF
jgi:hypothetical protein